jgi:hypothetical protein
MSESTAVAVTWHQYLDNLDDVVRRTELELAVHPGSFDPPREVPEDELPEGDMPSDCLQQARDIHERMKSLAAVIESQMEGLNNHRIALARETRPVFFDSRF